MGRRVDIHTSKHDIKWAVQKMPPSTPTVTVVVLVNVGSRNEIEGETWGLSHLLEHLLFKGTERYPNAMDLSRVVNKIGGDFNAFTDNERTAYHITVGKKYLQRAIRVLSQMICHPLILEKDFTKEKGAVVEELRREEDNPMSDIWNEIHRTVYKRQFGKNIGATVDSVRTLTPESMWKFFHTHYQPKNMVIGVAGDVNVPQLKTMLDKYFEWDVQTHGTTKGGGAAAVLKWNAPLTVASDSTSQTRLTSGHALRPRINTATRLARTGDDTPQTHPSQVSHKDKQTAQHHVCVAWPIEEFNYLEQQDRIADLQVLTSALGGYMSSRLWIFVREQAGGVDSTEAAWAYTVRMSLETYSDAAYICLYMGLRSDAVEKAMRETLHYLNTGPELSDTEVADAKGFLTETGNNEATNSDVHAQVLASNLGRMLRVGVKAEKVNTLEDTTARLANVTRHRVNNAYELYIREKKPHISYIGSRIKTAT